MNSDQKAAVDSIVKQWEGGEHMLAGQRASELVFGKSRKMNEDLFDSVRERVPGIERYIAAPDQPPVTNVADEGGYPLTNQPENRESITGASNVSSDEAKAEQNAIDATLAPGREAREAAGANADEVGSTKLNPDDSSLTPGDKPATKSKRGSK